MSDVFCINIDKLFFLMYLITIYEIQAKGKRNESN